MSLNQINYITGDATDPKQTGNKIIVHCCNNIGKWGKGFVLAISKRWKLPEQEYKKWYQTKENFELGQVQFVQVKEDLWVANLIGQNGIASQWNKTPIRYNAISIGLEKVALFAQQHKASIHMPFIGCGLAGGSWDKMAPIIQKQLSDHNLVVNVYKPIKS